LAGSKTQHNAESSVGVLSLAGKVPQILVTPTQDLGMVLNSIHGVKISGETNIPTAVQIAHLALKHRQNKHQKMRIVLFIGSPVLAERDTLLLVGRKLKKCNVALDIVNFGTSDLDTMKLTEFVSSVAKNGNSSLISVSPGESLTDKLIASTIFSGGSVSSFAAAAAAAQTRIVNDDQFEDDPALMMALRASLEEQAMRESEVRSINDENQSTNMTTQNDKFETPPLTSNIEKDLLEDSTYFSNVQNTLPGVNSNELTERGGQGEPEENSGKDDS
jgi:26S proteasome regulatory subunit N10